MGLIGLCGRGDGDFALARRLVCDRRSDKRAYSDARPSAIGPTASASAAPNPNPLVLLAAMNLGGKTALRSSQSVPYSARTIPKKKGKEKKRSAFLTISKRGAGATVMLHSDYKSDQ